MPAIEQQTGIPYGTLQRWVYRDTELDWRRARDETAISLSDAVTSYQSRIGKLLDQTLQICELLNERVLSHLRNGEPLDAVSLETLASAFQKNSDILLRLLRR